MQLICVDCKELFEARRKDTLRCVPCKKKHRSKQVMKSRKKRYPDIEVGVGSGNSSSNKPGPTNHSWKTGISGYRKLAKKEECAYCKSTRHLVIHHKDEDRHNNNLDNLIVLCKSCHQKHHVIRCSQTGQYLAKKNRAKSVKAETLIPR